MTNMPGMFALRAWESRERHCWHLINAAAPVFVQKQVPGAGPGAAAARAWSRMPAGTCCDKGERHLGTMGTSPQPAHGAGEAGLALVTRNEGQAKRKQPHDAPGELWVGYQGSFLHGKSWAVESPSLERLKSRVDVVPGDMVSHGLGSAGGQWHSLISEGFSSLSNSVILCKSRRQLWRAPAQLQGSHVQRAGARAN